MLYTPKKSNLVPEYMNSLALRTPYPKPEASGMEARSLVCLIFLAVLLGAPPSEGKKRRTAKATPKEDKEKEKVPEKKVEELSDGEDDDADGKSCFF